MDAPKGCEAAWRDFLPLFVSYSYEICRDLHELRYLCRGAFGEHLLPSPLPHPRRLAGGSAPIQPRFDPPALASRGPPSPSPSPPSPPTSEPVADAASYAAAPFSTAADALARSATSSLASASPLPPPPPPPPPPPSLPPTPPRPNLSGEWMRPVHDGLIDAGDKARRRLRGGLWWQARWPTCDMLLVGSAAAGGQGVPARGTQARVRARGALLVHQHRVVRERRVLTPSTFSTGAAHAQGGGCARRGRRRRRRPRPPHQRQVASPLRIPRIALPAGDGLGTLREPPERWESSRDCARLREVARDCAGVREITGDSARFAKRPLPCFGTALQGE